MHARDFVARHVQRLQAHIFPQETLPPLHKHTHRLQHFQRGSQSTCAASKSEVVFRPSLADVQSLSQGNAAKHRGTGSREVPHRLNADERKSYDIALQKKYLTLKGSGYRRERKGSPLANIFRQWCDASAVPCIVIQQNTGNNPLDIVVVDLVTLRQTHVEQRKPSCTEAAARLGAVSVEDVSEVIPFTIIVKSPHVDQPADEASLQKESEAQITPSMPHVPEAAFRELPIWQLPPQALAFTCERSTAKQLAQVLLKTITTS